MLPEYRDLMTKLKAEGDLHFQKLFDEHNELDTEIEKLESDPVASVSRKAEIDEMKHKKLHLKDELRVYLESLESEA
ncbi:YdcH family protein [Moraxella marmotae]|uniref:YdcH family protein n=1 Tax=Moraxella marmotae TaxID=3344520 RepID=UPI0035D48791